MVTGNFTSLVAPERESAIRGRAKDGTRDRRRHGNRRLLYSLRRMDGRSSARKTHGCFRSWLDPDRLRAAVGRVLGGAARRDNSLSMKIDGDASANVGHSRATGGWI